MRIRESDQLKTVFAFYEQDIEQKKMPPSYQRLGTMVKKSFGSEDEGSQFGSQKRERTVTGTLARSTSKGTSVSTEREQGECYQWKAKGKCTKEDACSFRHDHSKRRASARSSSSTPKSQTNNDGKLLRKAGGPVGAVHPGRGLQKLCKDYDMLYEKLCKTTSYVHQQTNYVPDCLILRKSKKYC